MSVARPGSIAYHLPSKGAAIRAAAGKYDSSSTKRWAALNRRRLRVLIYARYSTQEQDASSIEDQIAYCKKTLEAMSITDADITILDDPEKSGELRNRPGIDQVWEGIKTPKWDLLIVEDASRLFRNESALMDLAETAVDNGMRIVCINDDVDSHEQGWRDRLRDAGGHHAKANYFTRMRGLRRREQLWKMGAALAKLRSGYKRIPTHPATEDEPKKGPYFDEIDETWVAEIIAAFEQIGDGRNPLLVGIRLRDKGLARFVGITKPHLLRKQTIKMIRDPVYRGYEEFQRRQSEKKLRTGKKEILWNEDLWTREMPHHRMVSDPAWYRANQAIDSRRRREYVRGADHPLTGKPRNSRGPLSASFICDICKSKMYQEARAEGGYRCKNAKSNDCWNRASCVRQLAHQRIGQVIGDRLLSMAGILDALIDHTHALFLNDDLRKEREATLETVAREAEKELARLRRLAHTTDTPPASIVEDIRNAEGRVAESSAAVQEARDEAARFVPSVSRDRIYAALQEQAQSLISMNAETGDLLQTLVPDKIRAVPFQQFGSNNVVLRAEFELHIANILPDQLRAALRGSPFEAGDVSPVTILIDLFETPELVKHALRAVQLHMDEGLTLDETGRILGIGRGVAHRAKNLGLKMRAAGITDPYIRLTAPPANVSRWLNVEKSDQAKCVEPEPNSGGSGAA